MTVRSAAFTLAAVAGFAASASAQTVSGDLIILEGDALDGSTVASVNAPFTTQSGQVGLVVALDDGSRSIWLGSGSIFNSGSTGTDPTLSGGEGTMGISDAGQFVYSPSIDGGDGLWTEIGGIAFDDQPAADFPAGFNNTFHSRPRMTNDGTVYWMSGTNDGAGGTSTQNRIIYRRTTDGTVTGILRAGDVYAGRTVAGAGGISFDFAISDDNSQQLYLFNDAGAGSTAADEVLAVNGAVIAQEGFANGGGDNWDNFDATDINSAGNYVFSGDTDGDTATDEFIAYNGNIQLRENGSLNDGTVLDGAVDALSINENNESVFIWDIDDAGGDIETLFYAADASSMADAVALLSVGDGFDSTGDGVADWTVADFNASNGIGPGLDFAEDGFVFVEVDLESLDGIQNLEAIIRVAVPAPGTFGLLTLGGLAAARRRR
ncbi:MAG: PEP-CTERM sorting domain-containing protein [Phycisphaerales bacterium]